MDRLPNEIVLDILSRQPIRLFGQCKSVCVAWRDIIDAPGFFEKHSPHAKGLGENSLDNLCYDFGKIVKMFNDVRGYLREAIEWRMPMDSFTIDEVSDFHTAPVHFNMIHGLLDVRTVGGPDFQKLISKMWSDYYGRLTTHSPATVLGLIENRSRLYFVNARKKLGL